LLIIIFIHIIICVWIEEEKNDPLD
jgi:hypothetical protein